MEGAFVQRQRIIGILWLLCAVLIGAPAAEAASAPSASPAPPGSLRVAVNLNYPPFLFLDEAGKPQGYEADRWRLFEQHTGIRMQLVPMQWPDVIPALRDGRVDAIDIVYSTPARRRELDFSPPYATVPIAIFVDRRIRGIDNLAGLQGFSVGVERNDACIHWLQADGVARLQEFGSFEALVRAAAGPGPHIFCMANDAAMFYLARQHALTRFYEAFRVASPQLHIAVRRGDAALLQVITHGMAQITPPQRAQLERAWLEPPPLARPYLRQLKIVLAVASALTLLAVIWILTLQRVVARRTRDLTLGSARFRALLEGSPYAMWIKDERGACVERNGRADALFEPAAGGSIQTDACIKDPTFVARLQELDEAAGRTGAAQVRDLEYRQPDGTKQMLQVLEVPLSAVAGKPAETLMAALDITSQRRAERAQKLWANAFENAGFSVAIFDARSQTIVAVNATFAHERGYIPEEMAGWPVDRLYPADIVAERAAARKEIDRKVHSVVQTEHVTRTGRRFPVLLDCTVIHAPDGGPREVIVYARDLTERERHLAELQLAAVAFEAQEGLLVTDAAGVILRANAACAHICGCRVAEMIGQQAAELLQPTLQNETDLFGRVTGQLQDQGSWRGNLWLRIAGGESRPVRVMVSRVANADDRPLRYLVSIVDLTVEHAARASVDHMTFYDAITNLPNRYFLQGRLQRMQEGAGGALLMIHLDHFKRINELRGHAIGDRLLMLLAQRLTRELDERCLLGRFSGGTLVLLEGCHDKLGPSSDQALACATRVREQLVQPFDLGDGAPITITASIGWTRVIPGRSTPESAFKEAELAMYGAKAAGRDRVCQFEPRMLARLHYHDAITRELGDAIAGGGLELHLQAQTDRAGRVLGAEALLRWTRPNGDRVPPSVFIPIAEGSDLIVRLGDWVLARACAVLAGWAGRPTTRGLTLSVNVSARQFAEPEFVQHVLDTIAATHADPARLKLEITETVVLPDLDEVAGKLTALRAHHIQTSLDDFGTGYASLSCLSQLPLDEVKIDKSFVARLPNDSTNAVVTRAITTMGRGLGVAVIAEGVETRAQLDFLVEHGCNSFQGYLFARPMTVAAFEDALAQQPARVD